jgi:hypothetical protein
LWTLKMGRQALRSVGNYKLINTASYLTNVKPQLRDNSFEICGEIKQMPLETFK